MQGIRVVDKLLCAIINRGNGCAEVFHKSEHYVFDSIEGQVERSCFAHRDFLAVRFSGFAGARVLSIRPIIEGVQSVADRL